MSTIVLLESYEQFFPATNLTFAARRIIVVIFVAFLALIVVVVKHGDCEENLQERNFFKRIEKLVWLGKFSDSQKKLFLDRKFVRKHDMHVKVDDDL